jgi:filamentous hemagglutinin
LFSICRPRHLLKTSQFNQRFLMNTKCYRVIFNKTCGLLVAVAETARSMSGAGKQAGTSATTSQLVSFRIPVARLKAIAFALLLVTGAAMTFMPKASAQIVADHTAPAAQQPAVINTATGVPQVNITSPSAAGVSRNTFSQFDVQSNGAVLNNSRANVHTELGGWIQSNPNLASGTARIILNEVNSSNPSYLRGFVEVAGDRAQVVIANPSGISCSSCGFINANQVTLTTGVPVMNGGNLAAYVVRRGTVTIDGDGLNAADADYTNIIARAVRVNAGLWSKYLGVTTGANQVNADNTQATPIAGDGPAPSTSIDVAALGGMYAGHIFLTSTESGVGMVNAGAITSASNDVVLTANGIVANTGQITSAGTMQIAATSLVNDAGKINSTGAMQITAASLGNDDGQIHSTGAMHITAASLDNDNGKISSADAMHIAATSLVNGAGKIRATGTVDIDLGNTGTLDNAGGLIESDAALTANAGTIVNRNTSATGLGLHGQSVTLTADQIDNTNGKLIADHILSLTGSGHLNNTGGLISSGQSATISDRNAATPAAKTLFITNTGGTITARQNLTIDSAALTGDSIVQSDARLAIKLKNDFTNTGTLHSNTDLSLTSDGMVINRGQIGAVDSVTVSGASLDNQASGVISAATLHLAASDTMTNRGLINGADTFIDTGTLDNLGTGRIYGDHIAIGATTINNQSETRNGVTTAPVIAARTRLDIGAQTINNREHAQITSEGDMAIGGALDGNHQAIWQSDTLNNASATIAAAGKLDIDARVVNNTNAHFTTRDVEIFRKNISEYALAGHTTRWLPSQVDLKQYEVFQLNTPDGWGYVFTRYDYTRVITQTQVATSDPARITSGGAMRINANTVMNDNSIVLAGAALTGTVGSLTNTEVAGKEITTDTGTAYNYFDIERRGRDQQGLNVAAYAPAPTVQAINLTPTLYQQNAAVAPPGTQIASLSDQQAASLVTIPDSSSVTINTAPAPSYLVRSDPILTDYRDWLSSNYMLDRLGIDLSLTQKRLGDGYYEQKLLREQVAQLTGRRFLDGYASDEAQYRALMDAGVTVAEAYNLPVGVGLTAAQMAALTSDVVLLVQRDITLPDGSVTQALVPTLYVRLQDGDINGNGALIAGSATNLNVSGDLNNSGTIAGRTALVINADNINNLGGRITGATNSVHAATDINNGGVIDAKSQLTVGAGRDLNNISTTATTSTAQGTQTNINRVAALYVSDDNATLSATAGNDININAAQIVNGGAGGTTTLTAAKNINIGIVKESANQSIVWNDSNYRTEAGSREIGSTITTQGDLTISSGRDINVKGSGISSADGALVAHAAGDVNLSTASNTQSLDEGHVTEGSSGWFSHKTTTTHDTFDQNQVTGSSLNGNTVAVSGNNINVLAGSIASTAGTALTAAGNVTIAAATGTQSEAHTNNVTTSGIMGTGGIGFTIGSQSLATASSGDSTLQSQNRSVIGATGGDVTITAGKDVHIAGSDIIAGKADGSTGSGNIGIKAQNITIDPALDTTHSDQSFAAKQSGLTVAVVGTPLDTLRNLRDVNNGSGSTLQKVKGAFEEVGASAGTAPQVALTYGSSRSSGNTITDTASNSGSSLTAAGNLSLTATGNGTLSPSGKALDGNINVIGSQLTAGGAATLDAANDINIIAATDTASQKTGSDSNSTSITSAATSVGDLGRNISGGPNNSGVGLSPYNAGTGNGNGTTQASTTISSAISANSVGIISHTGDINVVGSSIGAQDDVSLIAQRGKINVTAGENKQSTHQDNTSKKIGDLGSSNSGTATSIGIRNTSDTIDTSQQLQNPVRSAIASNSGNVTLIAKDDLTVQGSDLSAGQNLTLTGKNVNLDAGTDTSRRAETQTSNQVGITASVGGMAGQLQQSVNQMLEAQAAGDSKLSKLYATKAALTAANQLQGIVTNGSTPALIKVTVALGASNSDSQSDTQATQQQGSTLAAGGTVTVTATGDGAMDANGKANNGDINAVGSQISGTDVTLNAARNLNLVASQDTIGNSSANNSGGASIGVGFALGGEQNGFTIELGANKLTADANGNSAVNQNTVVTASNTLTTNSGNDTNLVGAELRGNTVVSTVGGDLNIVSTQDTDDYTSEQNSSGFGASLCIPPICYGTTVQANVNVESGNVDSTYKSTTAQSGIYAGTGGYDIHVDKNTALVGGLIASAATPDKNSLTTGTLTIADLVNSASYSSDSSSISASVSLGGSGDGPDGKPVAPDKSTTLPENLINNGFSNLAGNTIAPETGDANSITKSAISPGTVTITDAAGQLTATGLTPEETIAGLDRDTANANQGIGKIFDLQEIQRNQKIARVTGEIAQQLAPLLYSRVGNLLVGEDTATKVALHALIGGLMSKVIGGDFGSGAIGAGAAAFAVSLFADQLQEIPGLSNEDRADLVQLLGMVTGKVAAQVAGGSSVDGNAAGVVAKLATEFNFLKHQQLDAFKVRYSSCTTEACRTQVFVDMKVMSDTQDEQLKTCITPGACKDTAAGEFNPLKQSWMGLFGFAPTDLLNFCNAGDSACAATLDYIAKHSNNALFANTNPASVAADNAVSAKIATMALEFQQKGLDEEAAYAAAIFAASAPGFAASLGSTSGGNSARIAASVKRYKLKKDALAALNRIRENPNGSSLNEKAPNSVLNRQQVNELNAGKLPGRPIRGPGSPREMPASPNPSATAEDFATKLLNDSSIPLEPIENCIGCWVAHATDGRHVTYRPAGQASVGTLPTTATVEFNSTATHNALNAKKVLKLKFPE